MRRGWLTVLVIAGCFDEPPTSSEDSTGGTAMPTSVTSLGATSEQPTSSPVSSASSSSSTSTSSSTTAAVTETTALSSSSSTTAAPEICPFGVRIQFDELSQSAELTDFVAPVRIGTDLPYAEAADDGADVVFRSADTAEVYPHELDTWRPGGESLFWVRVPRVDRENAQMLLCVGGDPVDPPASTVWHDFSVVWHFSEESDASPRLVDRSPTGLDVPLGSGAPERIDGVWGHAARFGPESQALRLDEGVLLAGEEELTLEMVYAPIEIVGYDELLRQAGTLSARANDSSLFQSSVELTWDPKGIVSTTYSGAASSTDTYHYLTATYSVTDGVFEVCMDGAPNCEFQVRPDLLALSHDDTRTIAVGRPDYVLDEVRLSSVRRSDGWIDATARGIEGTLLSFLDL